MKLNHGSKLMILLVAVGLVSCGVNVASFLVFNKDSAAYRLEQARTLMDQGEYSEALELLKDTDEDSNERRLLLAAARLGDANLDIWSIIQQLFDQDSSQGGSGVDAFFDSISSSLVGEGETRTKRFAALRLSLQDLASAPRPSDAKVRGLACFIAGIWTVPLATDATATMSAADSALTTVQTSQSGGECNQSAVDDLSESLTDIATLAGDFALITGAVADCAFINTSSAAGENSVEQQLISVFDSADEGCSTPVSCGPSDFACQALQLSCVGQLLTDSGDAVAGDGELAMCELVQGCYSGDCF